MKSTHIGRLAIITVGILLIPLIAMQFSPEVNWTAFDFVFAGVLIFGTGLVYQLVSRKGGNTAYRGAVAMALAAMFLLVWVNGAVGIIGNEGNPANLMYFGVIAILIRGAAVARLKPHGMEKALYVTAAAQFLVPLVALMIWRLDFSPGVMGVFVLNFFFVALFVGSAMLFRRASSSGLI